MSSKMVEDIDPEFVKLFDDGTVVMVAKIGGGTVGKMYDGSWWYNVYSSGEILSRGTDYYSGTPQPHWLVAKFVHEYFMEEI